MLIVDVVVTHVELEHTLVLVGPDHGIFWSAVTCYRFGLRRPVAAVLHNAARLNALGNLTDGCDRSQTTKALTGQRTPKRHLLLKVNKLI